MNDQPASPMNRPPAHPDRRRVSARTAKLYCEPNHLTPIFGCDALGPLHAAGASDPEFGASVRERNERRRRLLSVLVRRMAEGRKLRPKALGDLIDVVFALTSFQFFSQLTARGRTADAACGLIQELATDAVRRALQPKMGVR